MRRISQIIEESSKNDDWQEFKDGDCKIQVLTAKHRVANGIDGGRIVKLRISKDDKLMCFYDRGWDIRPHVEVTDEYENVIMQFNQ